MEGRVKTNSSKMNRIRVAIATNAMGKSAAGHDILTKTKAAKIHGFDGIEVAFECLEAHALSMNFNHLAIRSEKLKASAHEVHRLTKDLSLEIVSLQPFGFFDALTESHDIETRLQEAELWLQLCDIMEAPILQVSYFRA